MTAPRILAAFAVAALALAGCGTDPSASDLKAPIELARASISARLNPDKPTANLATMDPALLGTLRTALEKDGQPILLVTSKTMAFAGLMAPYGSNGNVRTWSTEQYVTLSTRNDMMVATRGFGPDLMSAVTPSLAQISAGQGTTSRRYYYLDGADQTQTYDYACTLARQGSQTISILGKAFATSLISESCSGPAGSFANQYWFDSSHILRQSQQFLVPGVSDLMLQRVID